MSTYAVYDIFLASVFRKVVRGNNICVESGTMAAVQNGQK